MLRKERIGDTKLQLALVKEVIFQLEAAQEHRLLTPSELDLRKQLKLRSVGLALIEKIQDHTTVEPHIYQLW